MKQTKQCPDYILAKTETGWETLKGQGLSYSGKAMTVQLEPGENSLKITAASTADEFSYLKMRWLSPAEETTLFLGDAFERGYGNLQWQHMNPLRVFPWYFMMTDAESTAGMGVEVRPDSFCFWQADAEGVTLWMDVRCGGQGVSLRGRAIHAATVVWRHSLPQEDAFDFAGAFCRRMCEDPVLPDQPVYGVNNWYSAYGYFTEADVLRDARLLGEMTTGWENRPFYILDDGWQEHSIRGYNGGPWKKGGEYFSDMGEIANGIKACGVRPGIWIRLLWNQDKYLPEELRLQRDQSYLDVSRPEVLSQVREDIRRMSDWGYEIIKHDFSTWDTFGKWGFEFQGNLTTPGWRFWDTGKTGAEIIKNFYKTIYEARGNAMILGCNCIGHLGAGWMHINRTGDDTSGQEWERTRKMGVNTLAFRMPQHNAFYAGDADCAPVTGAVPWALSEKWLELLGKSKSPLLISADLAKLTAEQKDAVIKALKNASMAGAAAKPLDWLYTACPRKWLLDGEIKEYDWMEKTGIAELE